MFDKNMFDVICYECGCQYEVHCRHYYIAKQKAHSHMNKTGHIKVFYR